MPVLRDMDIGGGSGSAGPAQMEVPPAAGESATEYSSEAFRKNLFLMIGLFLLVSFLWFFVVKPRLFPAS